jgi:formylglycine-generating enzyme required for sulfatase activity
MVIETALFAAALVEVAKKLAEKAIVEPTLEKGLEPFTGWLTGGFDAKKADTDLQKAFKSATQEIGAPADEEDNLANWLKGVGLDRLQAPKNDALRRQVALALVGFTDSQSAPPEDLMIALAWPRSRAGELSTLLRHLRASLAGSPVWRPLFDYADEAEKRGDLRSMLERLTLLANAVTSTPEGEALRVVIVERLKLSADQERAIEKEYRALVADEFRMHVIQGLVQVDKAVRLPLKDIYLELGLRPLNTKHEQDEEMSAMLKEGNAERLERSLREIDQRVSGGLAQWQQLVIVGKPGSGKTMSLKFIALMLALGDVGASRLGLNAPYLPIYLRLAQYAQALQERPTLSLEAYLHQYLADKYPGVPRREEFLPAALQNGACLVLLDGLDEVGDVGEKLSKGQTLRQIVLREVQRFASQRCGERCGNRLVVTSRLEGYHRGDLPGFTETELGFLRLPDEVESFLLRWYTAYIKEHDAQISFEAAEAQARESVSKTMNSISRSDSVKLLAINPLLLTILAVISENLHTPLPNRRAELYKIVAETLVKNWRRSQTDHENRIYQNNIGASDIYYIMASLAFWLHENKPGGAMPMADWRKQITILLAEFGDEPEISALVDEFMHHATEEAGLLTERSPEQIGFFHLTLEEYLAAVEIARQDVKTQLEMVSRHWQDPYWQEVLLLTAGELEQRGNREVLAAYLTNFLDYDPRDPQQAGRNIFLAGRALADIGPRAVGQNTQRAIKRALQGVAQELDFDTEQPSLAGLYKPSLRADCADLLDELGYVPQDLYSFVKVNAEVRSQNAEFSIPHSAFYISKYLVTNAQYARFLTPENFSVGRDGIPPYCWRDFPQFDENGQPMKESWGQKGWDWLQEALKDPDWQVEKGVLLPRSWNDPRFGLARRNAPVVGITWYEANAYCKWLTAQKDLPEWECCLTLNVERSNLVFRLPTENEWVLAAGGAENNRFAFGELQKPAEEIMRYANTRESGINRTTPVWMFPQGKSQPYEIMDLSGNVWEWQANYYNKSHNTLGLRGGSWNGSVDLARVSVRDDHYPYIQWNYNGFRWVVASLPS